MKNNWIVGMMILQVLSFFFIPFYNIFLLVSLFLAMVTSFFVVMYSDSWRKYLYPVFLLSWYIIAMRICGAIDFLELKERFFVFSGIGAASACILLSLKLAYSK